MNTILPLVLFLLGGLLVGGAWSLYKQGSSRLAVTLVGVLAALALGGGIAWLWPEGS